MGKYNIEGDEQVDLEHHGGEDKAVYAFSFDHYGHWREVLDNNELNYGAFGENLTIAGLDESKLHIGDQLSIGECIFQVTQPRVPCYKLGIALASAEAPQLFQQDANTGMYLRVIRQGRVAAGDEVIPIKRGSPQISVKSLFALTITRTIRML